MKLNDVIDIDGKLYKIVYLGMSGNFEAEFIGEVVGKGFVREESQSDNVLISKLNNFCKNIGCSECPLEKYLNCKFEEYTSEQLNEAYNTIKENDYENID